MLKIVDHAYEPETVLALNHAKVLAALNRGEAVLIYHSKGFVHGRLANLPGAKYVEDLSLPRRKDLPGNMPISLDDKELLRRLTSNQDYRMPYGGKPRGDIFIHWFYRNRREDKLSLCEMFHLNMLRRFNVMDRVGRIHIRCAPSHGIRTGAMDEAVRILASGKADVDFKTVPQNESWEHDTIKEAAEFAIETGRFVYYTHFKGVTRIDDPLFGGNVRKGYGALDIFYWAWLLYEGLFGAPADSIAIGPLLRDGINKTYMGGAYDISWSSLGNARYHYSGSFQGFDGVALKGRMITLGLGDKAARDRKLWVGDPYTVEMLLGLAFPRTDVSTAYFLGPVKDYNLYSRNVYPYRRKKFVSLYTSKDCGDNPPAHINARYAVITYCYGEHKILREPLVVDDYVAYICVTDDPNFKAPPGSAWHVVYDPWDMFDGRFRHMNAKFRPFRYTEAEKALVIDSSIQITGSVRGLFELPCPGVLLKGHPLAATVGVELPRWIPLRGMPREDNLRFRRMLSLAGAGLDAKEYEGDVVLWKNVPAAKRFGEDILAFVEGAGEHEPFMSNQLCMSALAVLFHDIVGEFSGDLPMRKYRHNTWIENTKWKMASVPA